MARFGRSFVQAATQPAFTQGLFTAAAGLVVCLVVDVKKKKKESVWACFVTWVLLKEQTTWQVLQRLHKS